VPIRVGQGSPTSDTVTIMIGTLVAVLIFVALWAGNRVIGRINES